MQVGRPTIFTKELGKEICERIALGESVIHITKDERMPASSQVYKWLFDDDKKDYQEEYTRARAIQAEKMFEEIIDISDDGSNDFMVIQKGKESYEVENKEVTNRSRLRVDTRKWYLSKVLPKKFGEKLDLTSGNKPIPLLNVLHSNSDKEDSEAEKAD